MRLQILRPIALILAFCMSMALPVAARGRHQPVGRSPYSRTILGAWELAWPEPAPGTREVKLITGSHFSWTTWNVQTHAPLASGGGPYVLEGKSYKEQLLFASGGASEIAGTVQSFHVRVMGDTLYQSRPPGNDEGKEVWRRMR